MANNLVTITPEGKLTVLPGATGKYTVTGTQNGKNVKLVLNCNVPAGALELVYEIPEAGKYPLFYEKVSPAGNEKTISVFPEGSTGKLTKAGSNEVVTVDLYHETTSKADTCFEYTFAEAGTYTLTVDKWKGNTNDPGIQNPDDLGTAVYAQMFRGSKITTLKAVNAFAFPGNVTSFYSMFNSCTATGHMPSVISETATRPTDMFDSAKFETIGNIVMPNSWKAQTSGAAGSDQAQSAKQMFVACSNLKSIGNVVLGNCINTENMFSGDSNLEKIGVLDCLKDSTNVDGMFNGCTKLSSVKFKSLPTAAEKLLDLSACPLDADSLNYMATNVNNGAAKITFSATTAALSNFATCATALKNKGYNVTNKFTPVNDEQLLSLQANDPDVTYND